MDDYNAAHNANDTSAHSVREAEFYQVFREHAQRHGIARTWQIFYTEFTNGGLLLAENTVFGYLAAFLSDRDRYAPTGPARPPWGLMSTTATDLDDGELFSLDGGTTWSMYPVLPDSTRAHSTPPAGPDTMPSPAIAPSDDQLCLVARPLRSEPTTAPTRAEQGDAGAFDPDHPCLTLQNGEALVTYDHTQSFPALVKPGYAALPLFRADVALQIARYVAGQNTGSTSPDVDEWLVISPDQRSIVHLGPGSDVQGNWRFDLIAVDSLFDRNGQPERCLIGAGRWPWTYDPSHNTP